jgi:hypothetical protein
MHGSDRIRLGMLPTRVIERATVPVTVVTHGRGRSGVLTGVDGSEHGAAAVEYGFHYAPGTGSPSRRSTCGRSAPSSLMRSRLCGWSRM